MRTVSGAWTGGCSCGELAAAAIERGTRRLKLCHRFSCIEQIKLMRI